MNVGPSNITGSLALTLFSMLPKLGNDQVQATPAKPVPAAANSAAGSIDVSAITGKGSRIDRVV